MSLYRTASATDAGSSPSSLRRQHRDGRLVRLRRGAYVAPETRTPAELHRLQIDAAVPFLGDHSVFSHISAAVLHGLPVMRGRLERVTVIRPSGGYSSAYLHSRKASLDADEVCLVDGLRVTTLARTVEDLASTLPFREGLACADAALVRGLGSDVLRPRGKFRARIKRVALSADGRAESPGESFSRALMIETCLPTPKLQYEVRDPRGSFIGRTDFAWPELGVLGEFDGRVKYDGSLGGSVTPADIIMREKEREARLRDAGFTVVRWGWDALMRPGVLERRLRQALSS